MSAGMMDTDGNKKKSLTIGSGKPFTDFHCKQKINFLKRVLARKSN